jgi:hypothetical protein
MTKGFDKIAALPVTTHPTLGSLAEALLWYNTMLDEGSIPDPIKIVLADYAATYKKFSVWMNRGVADQSEGKSFFAILSLIVDAGKFDQIDAASFVTKYLALTKVLGEERKAKLLDRIGQLVVDSPQLFGAIQAGTIPNQLIEDIVGRGESSPLMVLVELVDGHLKGLSQTDWEAALAGETEPLRLLLVRRATGAIELPADTFKPALLANILGTMRGELTPKTLPDLWAQVTLAVPPGTRKKLPNDVLNGMNDIVVTTQGAENFVVFYSVLANELPMSKSPDILLDRLIVPLLSSSSPVVAAFIRERAKDIAAAVQKASTDTVQALDEAIAGIEGKSEESLSIWMAEVRGLIGVPKTRAEATAEVISVADGEAKN